jgi:hypothetical protein
MARGHDVPSASARPRRPALVPAARGGGAERHRTPPYPVHGPGSPPAPVCPVPPASACPAPAQRGLELGQCAAPRDRPQRGPIAARGAQRGACVAQPRHVRGPSATRQRDPTRTCSRGARGALARLAVPSVSSSTPRRTRLPPLPPPVYPMRSDRVISINKWKLDLGIGYVSYFM